MTMLYDRAAGLVSVIIPAYDYDGYIIDTLESLKRQTYSDIEIILIDDCSQDNTKTIVNEWLTKNSDRFADFIYIRLPRNLGFEWAVNIGLCLSKGEYVVFHDADDISHEEKIEKQVDVFKFSGFYELSSENAQIWNYVIGVFEQIVIAGADIEITPREYRKMIEAGFKEVKINIIPPTLDKVTVGEADKISAKSSKVLFVMGANEGMLDSKKNENGLLLDDERKSLAESGMKLLNDSDYYIYKEKHMLYKLLTGASDKLYISYAMGTEDGKALQPSIYVERLRQLFPLARVQSDLGDIDESINVSNHKGPPYFGCQGFC